MPTPGDKLGPYQLLAPVGEGGMGEVWKARDARLDRTVAIKFSKEEFNERFEREARAVAALNHPHICQLYDVGPDYLVMEYIEGTPLQGPMPVEKAVEYASQILDALDAAHRKKITHRDLKPANILVTKQGIKLLDFGLAKQQAVMEDPEATVKALTVSGTILGTLQYMSPEQLQGKEADPRSDIFSFGCVLYELLGGKRAFDGSSVASIIGAVLHREPEPIGANPLAGVIHRCLAKDPEDRFQNIRDLKYSLTSSVQANSTVASSAPRSASRYPWLLAALLGMAWLATLVYHFRARPAPVSSVRLQLAAPAAVTQMRDSVISPDGRKLAFVGASEGKIRVWIRPLNSTDASPLSGTENAAAPFWSPDSRFLGFFADGELRKVEASGGPVQPICPVDALNPQGTWGSDGVILYQTAVGGLMRVSATGGTPSEATKLSAGEILHMYPTFLPDGKHFLYSASSRNVAYYVGTVEGSPQEHSAKPLLTGPSLVQPVNLDRITYLLHVARNGMNAQRIDAGRGELVGEAITLFRASGNPRFSSSQTGVLTVGDGSTGESSLRMFDSSGNALGVFGGQGIWGQVQFSPDGTRVAADRRDQDSNSDIWVVDLKRNVETRFTSDPAREFSAQWAPDGTRIAWPRQGAIVVKSTTGGSEEVILENPQVSYLLDWSPDGKHILFGSFVNRHGRDVFSYSLEDGRVFPYLQTEFDEGECQFAPNGTWVAYYSSDARQRDVYISPFPEASTRIRVSNAGGTSPRWRGDGQEIYYRNPEGKIVAVPVMWESKSPRLGQPRVVLQTNAARDFFAFDVSSDGKRFLVNSLLETNANTIQVILNWPTLLKGE